MNEEQAKKKNDELFAALKDTILTMGNSYVEINNDINSGKIKENYKKIFCDLSVINSIEIMTSLMDCIEKREWNDAVIFCSMISIKINALLQTISETQDSFPETLFRNMHKNIHEQVATMEEKKKVVDDFLKEFQIVQGKPHH